MRRSRERRRGRSPSELRKWRSLLERQWYAMQREMETARTARDGAHAEIESRANGLTCETPDGAPDDSRRHGTPPDFFTP